MQFGDPKKHLLPLPPFFALEIPIVQFFGKKNGNPLEFLTLGAMYTWRDKEPLKPKPINTTRRQILSQAVKHYLA
jgi:hypothetical protein